MEPPELHRLHHDVASTTHTPELRQLHELNARLAQEALAGTWLTAGDLGMGGQPVERVTGGASASGGTLPAEAVLLHLVAEGPPDFPYVEGHFAPSQASAAAAGTTGQAAGGGPQLVASVHTAALRTLSHRFYLRHVWGA
jgi:hypothetical protein